jgi:hypothetical protein
VAFDYSRDYSRLDLREEPYLYSVGKGEQGVLLVEPYKSELLPLWRFKTPEIARESSAAILRMFYRYKAEEDFVGMDMARKFLQMGYTRARRYANHKSGKKYDGPVPPHKKGASGAHGRAELKRDEDPEKALAAKVFHDAWQKVEEDQRYRELREEWKLWYG